MSTEKTKWTVRSLQAALETAGLAAPKKAKKADLLALWGTVQEAEEERQAAEETEALLATSEAAKASFFEKLMQVEELTAPEPIKKANKKTATKYKNVRYGKAITTPEVYELVKEMWGDLLTVEEVYYDGHYWKGTVVSADGEIKAQGRMDYLISYLRPPRAICQVKEIKEFRRTLED